MRKVGFEREDAAAVVMAPVEEGGGGRLRKRWTTPRSSVELRLGFGSGAAVDLVREVAAMKGVVVAGISGCGESTVWI